MPKKQSVKTTKDLLIEIEELKTRLIESEEAINAIRNGEVDAIIVSGTGGEKVFSLTSSETPYRILLENMSEGAVTLNSDGNVLYCNQCFAEMMSVPISQIIGSECIRFISDQEKEKFRNLIKKGRREKVNGLFSFKMERNSSFIHLQLSFQPIPDEISGEISIIFSDVTSMKKYQEQLEAMVKERTMEIESANEKLRNDIIEIENSRKSLYESEQKYHTTLDSIGDAVISTDLKGNITYMNPLSENLTGWTFHDAMNKPVKEVFNVIDEDTLDEIENPVVEALEHGIIFVGLSNHTLLIRKDGSKVSIADSAAVIKDSQGDTQGVVLVFRDMTKTRLKDQKLRESEEKFRSLAENIPSVLMRFDSELRVIYLSPIAERFTGIPSAQVIGKTNREVGMPEDLCRLWEDATQAVFYTGKAKNIEFDLQTPEGKSYFYLQLAPEFGPDGAVSHVLGISTDITERKKSEELSLRQKEILEAINNILKAVLTSSTEKDLGIACLELVRKIIRSKFGFIGEINKDGLEEIAISNPYRESRKILNKEGHRIQKASFKIHGIYGRVISDGKSLIANNPSTHPDSIRLPAGHPPLNSFLGVPLVNRGITIGILALANRPGGYSQTELETVEALVPTLVEAFMRKRAEEEHKKMFSDLKEAQQRLKIGLENGNIGLWEWEIKTNVVKWDERTEKMFGIEPGSFGKTYNAFENLVHEEDISHVQKAIKNSLERDLPFETLFRTKPKSGKTKYISSKALINKEEKGQPVNLIGVCFDVTSLREGTEILVLKLNEELLRSNKELESFAYVASHDLQEPLRMVTSFTQLLAHQYKDKLDDRAQEYMNFVVEGSQRMYDLLNGLLAYSRIQTKGEAFTCVNLNNVLKNVTKILSLQIKESNTAIEIEKLPDIFADENQLTQLFQNLIVNSIKFSLESPRIYISSSVENGNHVFSVKDEGMGIESQYFDKIFKIFQRLNPRDQFEGTGIGLAICKRIIERHGGKIWVESVPGRGSTFIFTIPNRSSD